MNLRFYFGITFLAYVVFQVAVLIFWWATPARPQDLPPGAAIGGLGVLNFGCSTIEGAVTLRAMQRGAIDRLPEGVRCFSHPVPAPSILRAAEARGEDLILTVEVLGTREIVYTAIARPGQGA
jgi:hypothetical protein